jgi:hypothetical protein
MIYTGFFPGNNSPYRDSDPQSIGIGFIRGEVEPMGIALSVKIFCNFSKFQLELLLLRPRLARQKKVYSP